MAFKPIEILINAKDNASSVFGKVQAAAGALGAALLAYFGINAFAGVVKGAASFEEALSRVQSATDATAAEMVDLRKAAEAVGAEGSFSSVQAAEALENLAKAGLNAKDAVATLPAVMVLAKTENIALGTSAEFVTKIVMGMGLAFADAGRVADVLAKGAKSTNTSVVGLSQAMSYAAPLANSLGLSLEFTVAMMGQFAQGGIDASRAGTALNSILSQFSDPASKFRLEMAAAGITTGNFEDALHQLAAAGPAGQKAILAVGQEAGPALRVLLNQGMGALDQLTVSLKNAQGSAAAAAAVMTNNLNGSLTQLGNAWQFVKDTLATPVLPVLRQGVDELAAAFRAAVADGTVQRFGEAIATAFANGLKFVREFLAGFNFTEAIGRLQAFADETNAKLTLVAQYASNTADAFKLAWGVMAAGANGVQAAILGVGSIFADTLAQIQGAVARLYELAGKLPLGALSKQWAEIGKEIRLSSDATAAAAQAMRDRAKQALLDVADGAQTAREGFQGLANGANESAPAITSTAQATAALTKELQSGAEAAAKAGSAYQKKVNDEQLAARSADEHKVAIAKLRAEYSELVASGSLQGAAEKLREINRALAETPAAAKEATRAAAEAAAQIDAAFQRLGVVSSATLKQQAAAAQRDYATIKNAGTSTAEDIGLAFAKAAQAAIDANKGIAPSWVVAEAGVRGYKIATDAAGKSSLQATDRMSQGWRDVGSAATGAGQAASAAAQKLQQALDEILNRNKVGNGSDLVGKSGDVREAAVLETDITADIVKRYGEDMADSENARKAWALRQQLQNYKKSYGNVTRSQESLNQQRNIAAELARVEGLIEAERNGGKANGGTTAASKPTTNTPTAPTTSSGGSSRTPGGSGISGPTSTVVFDLKSGPRSIEGMTPSDVNVINSVLQELINGKGTAR